MKKRLFILFFMLFIVFLYSNTLLVKQDGTGDYINIQDAITSSVDGDTVLVYPGIYYENINYNGKSITLGSLYLTTQDEFYIENTIIDGNYNGSVVSFINNENNNAVLCGFTIRNGRGTLDPTGRQNKLGGGIFIYESSPILEHCILINNEAYYGGGIATYNPYNSTVCNPIFKKLSIKYNHAFWSGGGVAISKYSYPQFYQGENLSNLYLNYSTFGNDIAWFDDEDAPEIYLSIDTLTVTNPSKYYFYSLNGHIHISVNYSKIQLVNHDLYVSPTGNNSNSGLTPSEPLKNLWYAYTIIASDSLHPNTIYLSNGIYSPSQTNDIFPITPKSYVSLIGENRANTIIDIEDQEGFFFGYFKGIHNFLVKNITIISSVVNNKNMSIFSLNQPIEVYIDSLYFYRSNIHSKYGVFGAGINYENNELTLIESTSFFVKNVVIEGSENNSLGIALIENAVLENVKIIQNHPYEGEDDGSGITEDNGLAVSIQGYNEYPLRFKTKLINMEITNCERIQTNLSNTLSALVVLELPEVYIINSTISNNHIIGPSNDTGGAVGTISQYFGGDVIHIINSIITGNTPNNLFFGMGYLYTTEVNIQNSLIGNIYVEDNVQINDLGNNIFSEDPQFVGEGDYPFALSSQSPCIDAGTLDLPEGVELPERDLAGNPRIVGASVDMGAYEYQGTSSNEDIIEKPKITSISVYPNPFSLSKRGTKNSVKINLELSQAGEIELSIYNLKGQKVKRLIKAQTGIGTYNAHWDLTDDNGKTVSSGLYFVKLVENGKVTRIGRITLLK